MMSVNWQALPAESIAYQIEAHYETKFPMVLKETIKAIKLGSGQLLSPAQILVKSARRASGKTQADFAELIGVQDKTMQKWELGRAAPSEPVLSLMRIIIKDPSVLGLIERT